MADNASTNRFILQNFCPRNLRRGRSILARKDRLRQRWRMSAPGTSLHPRSMIAVVVMAIVFESAACQSVAWSEIPAIASRQRVEKKTFTDIQIADGFFKTAFGAEYHLAGRVDRIRKYGGPVRVFAEGNDAEREAQLAKVVAAIGQRVQHLDI